MTSSTLRDDELPLLGPSSSSSLRGSSLRSRHQSSPPAHDTQISLGTTSLELSSSSGISTGTDGTQGQVANAGGLGGLRVTNLDTVLDQSARSKVADHQRGTQGRNATKNYVDHTSKGVSNDCDVGAVPFDPPGWWRWLRWFDTADVGRSPQVGSHTPIRTEDAIGETAKIPSSRKKRHKNKKKNTAKRGGNSNSSANIKLRQVGDLGEINGAADFMSADSLALESPVDEGQSVGNRFRRFWNFIWSPLFVLARSDDSPAVLPSWDQKTPSGKGHHNKTECGDPYGIYRAGQRWGGRLPSFPRIAACVVTAGVLVALVVLVPGLIGYFRNSVSPPFRGGGVTLPVRAKKSLRAQISSYNVHPQISDKRPAVSSSGEGNERSSFITQAQDPHESQSAAGGSLPSSSVAKTKSGKGGFRPWAWMKRYIAGSEIETDVKKAWAECETKHKAEMHACEVKKSEMGAELDRVRDTARTECETKYKAEMDACNREKAEMGAELWQACDTAKGKIEATCEDDKRNLAKKLKEQCESAKQAAQEEARETCIAQMTQAREKCTRDTIQQQAEAGALRKQSTGVLKAIKELTKQEDEEGRLADTSLVPEEVERFRATVKRLGVPDHSENYRLADGIAQAFVNLRAQHIKQQETSSKMAQMLTKLVENHAETLFAVRDRLGTANAPLRDGDRQGDGESGAPNALKSAAERMTTIRGTMSDKSGLEGKHLTTAEHWLDGQLKTLRQIETQLQNDNQNRIDEELKIRGEMEQIRQGEAGELRLLQDEWSAMEQPLTEIRNWHAANEPGGGAPSGMVAGSDVSPLVKVDDKKSAVPTLFRFYRLSQRVQDHPSKQIREGREKLKELRLRKTGCKAVGEGPREWDVAADAEPGSEDEANALDRKVNDLKHKLKPYDAALAQFSEAASAQEFGIVGRPSTESPPIVLRRWTGEWYIAKARVLLVMQFVALLRKFVAAAGEACNTWTALSEACKKDKEQGNAAWLPDGFENGGKSSCKAKWIEIRKSHYLLSETGDYWERFSMAPASLKQESAPIAHSDSERGTTTIPELLEAEYVIGWKGKDDKDVNIAHTSLYGLSSLLIKAGLLGLDGNGRPVDLQPITKVEDEWDYFYEAVDPFRFPARCPVQRMAYSATRGNNAQRNRLPLTSPAGDTAMLREVMARTEDDTERGIMCSGLIATGLRLDNWWVRGPRARFLQSTFGFKRNTKDGGHHDSQSVSGAKEGARESDAQFSERYLDGVSREAAELRGVWCDKVHKPVGRSVTTRILLDDRNELRRRTGCEVGAWDDGFNKDCKLRIRRAYQDFCRSFFLPFFLKTTSLGDSAITEWCMTPDEDLIYEVYGLQYESDERESTAHDGVPTERKPGYEQAAANKLAAQSAYTNIYELIQGRKFFDHGKDGMYDKATRSNFNCVGALLTEGKENPPDRADKDPNPNDATRLVAEMRCRQMWSAGGR
ncbi:unnamed protein product [Amoebophrya sp. A25]|nr:unnamed protein product [Amoebophrya sp. A25]|eukprot:GSA25T00017806001.1